MHNLKNKKKTLRGVFSASVSTFVESLTRLSGEFMGGYLFTFDQKA
jgi:hypothetical protein